MNIKGWKQFELEQKRSGDQIVTLNRVDEGFC